MRIIKTILVCSAIVFCGGAVLSSLASAEENSKTAASKIEIPKSEAPKAEAPKVEAKKPAPPVDNDEQSSYVYDLKKLIEKSKNNIKRVNEKIQEQAIYKRNQQREEKAREYYERAVQLFEEGKTQEASDLWEKSIRITEHPEMKTYIKGSEKRFKLQADALKKEERGRVARSAEDQKIREQQVSEAYTSAVALYKQKKFKEAREEFMLVEGLIPEYKATRSYLKLLEQNIAVQDKEDLKNQKVEIARQQEEAEAARVREKEMWRKEIDLKEQQRRAKLNDQAKDVYKQALELYNKKDFLGAKEKFQEVEWVLPDYKSTRKYLDKLDADIQKSEQKFVAQGAKDRAKMGWQEELARRKLEAQQKKEFEEKTEEQKRKDTQEAEISYQSGVQLTADKKYQEARDKFLEVQRVYPDYKATASYLSRLNDKLGIIETAPEKVSGEVKAIYAEAVKAYKAKDYALAKLKFERVEFMYPSYEATRKYLSKLDKDYDLKKAVVSSGEEAILKEGDPAFSGAQVPAVMKPDGKPVTSKEYDELVKTAEPKYAEALKFYEDKKFDDALKGFTAVEDMLPNYKSTRPYLKRVGQQIKKVEQQRYKEEQTQQAETINLLAKQASTLYQKIQRLADDRASSSAKKKFAMVDKIFANMSREQAKLLAEIAEEEQKLKLEEIAYEQEVQKSEFANIIDPIYDEAVRLYQAKRYDEAKAKFLEAQSKLADYRSSTRYLVLIDKQNMLLSQVMKDREERIADYQVKADEGAKLYAKQQMQAKEEGIIRELMAQAESINDEIMSLSKDRNFEVIKAKFAELEKVVDNLLTVKGSIVDREQAEHQASKKAVTDPSKNVAPSGSQSKEEEPKAADDAANQAAISRLTASSTSGSRRADAKNKADMKKRFKAMDKQNRDLYHQAKQDYDAGRYGEAKVKFVSLEQQPGYSNASRKYIRSIDQILLKKQGKLLNQQTRQQEEYLKGRVERERVSFKAKEAGVAAVAADRAKARAFADSGVTPVYPGVGSDYSDALNLRSRRTVTDNSQQVSNMKETVAPVDERDASVQKELQSSGVSPNEDASWLKRRQQKAFSDKRKKYLDDKFKTEQKNSDQKSNSQNFSGRDRRVPVADDQLTKQQRARERKQRSIYERELRKTSNSGLDRAMADADLQDKRNRDLEIRKQQDFLRQQREEEKLQRRDKERQITTMISQGREIEGAPKTDLSDLRGNKSKRVAAQADDVQSMPSSIAPASQLQKSKVEKETMRKQFESGVDELYKEALSFYKSGMYTEARDKFSDVEDLSPDYKRTRNYMERADQEIIKEQKRRAKVKDQGAYDAIRAPEVSPRSKAPAASTPAVKKDAVSSALDMYESQLQ